MDALRISRRLTVCRHDSDLGRWSETVLAPHPALADHVAMMWLGEGSVTYRRDRLLPRGMTFLLMNLGPPIYLCGTGGGPPRAFTDFWFCGQQETFLETEAPHGTVMLGVGFRADGAYPLIGVAQGELVGEVVELAALLGDGIHRVRQRVLEAPSTAARLALVERWLLELAGAGRRSHPATGWAVRRIATTAGQVRVDALAADSGYSRKHLSELFRRDVGLSLKGFARLHRFHRALAMLRAPENAPWGLVAAECGYYDQAHLNRDVRAFAGCSPGELVAAQAPDDTTLVVG